MNTFLLITFTVTVALVYGQNSSPCQRNNNNNAYYKFAWNHILKDRFRRSSETEWRRYLTRHGICHRPIQSFIEKRDQRRVESICNGHGRQLYPHNSNLCISDFQIPVYQVEAGRGCKDIRLDSYSHYVIVACDKIGNRCLPSHYEEYFGQNPDTSAPLCRP